jgi:hypothetical protein
MDLRETVGGYGLESVWVRVGTGGDSFEHGNEYLGFIKSGEFD